MLPKSVVTSCTVTALVLLLLSCLLGQTTAQWNETTLPDCCTVNGAYDEAFSGVLNTHMAVNCTNCGPELTVLGDFTSLTYIAQPTTDTEPTGSLSIVCTNCTSLTSLGVFAALVNVVDGCTLSGHNCPGATGNLIISCTDCPVLTALGMFSEELIYIGYYFYATGTLTLSCTDCSTLTTLGNFTTLNYIGYNGGTGTFTLSCTNCLALTILGDFGALKGFGNFGGTGSIDLACTSCPSLCPSNQGIFSLDPSLRPQASISCISCRPCEDQNVYTTTYIPTTTGQVNVSSNVASQKDCYIIAETTGAYTTGFTVDLLDGPTICCTTKGVYDSSTNVCGRTNCNITGFTDDTYTPVSTSGLADQDKCVPLSGTCYGNATDEEVIVYTGSLYAGNATAFLSTTKRSTSSSVLKDVFAITASGSVQAAYSIESTIGDYGCIAKGTVQTGSDTNVCQITQACAENQESSSYFYDGDTMMCYALCYGSA